MPNNTKSVLIIGATGALGLQIIRHVAEEPTVSELHVFCRNPSKLSESDKRVCDSIITGDARRALDIERAIAQSKADYVVLATGNGADVRKTDTRQKTGEALAHVMRKPAFRNVKAVIVSSHGAGDTKIKVGMGIGMMIAHHLRHVLADHTLQEKAFDDLMDRTVIVRPTALTDDKSGKDLVEFDGNQKGPTINIDRSDLAAWISREISADPADFCGRKLSLTSAK